MSRRIAANRVPERLRGESGALPNTSRLRAIFGRFLPVLGAVLLSGNGAISSASSSISRTRSGTQSRRSGSDAGRVGRAEFETRVRQLVAGDQLIASLIDCMLHAR
jgi:hypothetical protein